MAQIAPHASSPQKPGDVQMWNASEGHTDMMYEAERLKTQLDTEVVDHQLLKKSAKKIAYYCCFIFVFTWVLGGNSITDSFWYSNRAKELFLGGEMRADYTKVFAKTYFDILVEDDFWEFLHQPLITNIWESAEDSSKDPQYRGYVLGQAKLVGAIRLKQERSFIDEDCGVPPVYKGKIHHCYSEHADPDATVHVDIPGPGTNFSMAEAHRRIQDLRDANWIDERTRDVHIYFTLFNPNVHLFISADMRLEFRHSGGIYPFATFRTVAFFKHLLIMWPDGEKYVKVNGWLYVNLIMELLFILFLASFYFYEGKQLYKQRLKYFSSFWNVLDFFNLAAFLIVVTFRFLATRAVAEIKFDPANDEYVDFVWAAFLIYQISNWNSANMILTYMKLFKYFEFSPRLALLTSTVASAGNSLKVFAVMFAIMFAGFSQAFHLGFGMDLEGYKSVSFSIMTLLEMMLGAFDMEELRAQNSFLGPLLFLLYIFAVFFLMLNMILSIINDAFVQAKESAEERMYLDKANFDFASRAVSAILNKATPVKLQRALGLLQASEQALEKAKQDITGAAGNDDLNIEKLMSVINANEEAKAALAAFDVDGDGNFSEEEVKNMIKKFDVDGDGKLDLGEVTLLQGLLDNRGDVLARLRTDLEQELVELDGKFAMDMMKLKPRIKQSLATVQLIDSQIDALDDANNEIRLKNEELQNKIDRMAEQAFARQQQQKASH